MPLVFLSYKHGDPWTAYAQRFELRLGTVAEGIGFDLFVDSNIEASAEWRAMVEGKLANTTHFVCLLCDEYWASKECQLELAQAVTRYKATGAPKLLFVLAEKMSPHYLKFAASKHGELVPPKDAPRQIEKVSDLNFLGPFDQHGRLVALSTKSDVLGDQLYQMVERLRVTMPQ